MEQQKQYQALTNEYQSLQNDMSSLVTARQKLESQQQENKSVQTEFNSLSDDAGIYKLVGPVLLKQDSTEAKSTVDGRLEYIGGEIKRIEDSIKEITEKSETKKMQIMQIQGAMQQQGAAQG
ncbi:hypothetical protein Q7P37_008403 [Cladosporium fusiforme]